MYSRKFLDQASEVAGSAPSIENCRDQSLGPWGLQDSLFLLPVPVLSCSGLSLPTVGAQIVLALCLSLLTPLLPSQKILIGPIPGWATLDPITVSRFPSVVWLAGVKLFFLRESGDRSTGAHHRRGVEVPCADKVWDEISRVIPNPGPCHLTATSPREESAQDLWRLGVNLVSLQTPFHFYHRVCPRPPAAHPPPPC